jgi:2-methylisocitrate lyase-like PEP mutase family enzyme
MDPVFKFKEVSSTPLYGFSAGEAFRERVRSGKILPLCGIHDSFSALIAARYFEGVFLSGFGLAASLYGLPDIGYMNWRDMQDFAARVRLILPRAHILVDIDDGFGEEVISANTVNYMEAAGVSAVMFEDQKRPRRCGHFEGKQVLPADQYLTKLRSLLSARRSLFVIARVDSTDMDDAFRRAKRYVEAGADGIMIEAIHDLDIVRKLEKEISIPIMVNQLNGGKSPNWTVAEMQDAGVDIVIYSTPTLFSAQHGMQKYLAELVATGRLPNNGTATMSECVEMLHSPPNYNSFKKAPSGNNRR